MPRTAWNKGLVALTKDKAVGKKRAFSRDEVADICKMLRRDPSVLAVRNLGMFRFGIDTMLRSCDVVRIPVGLVYRDGEVVETFTWRQKKTGVAQECDLFEETRQALAKWLQVGWEFSPARDDPLFNLTERRHRQLVKEWAKMIRLNPSDYSTHSVRRTKAKEVYRQTKNLGMVRELLGHKTIAATGEYLGIEREDARKASREVKI